eukprot:174111-Rhodomonas_salina.1
MASFQPVGFICGHLFQPSTSAARRASANFCPPTSASTHPLILSCFLRVRGGECERRRVEREVGEGEGEGRGKRARASV